MQLLREMLEEKYDCDIDEFIDVAIACRHDVNESANVFELQLSGDIEIDAVQREAQRQFESLALDAALDFDSIKAFEDDHGALPSNRQENWFG